MMKEEFESLLGDCVSERDYSAIETIYTAYERFSDKQVVVDFWKSYGREGVDALVSPIKKLREKADAIYRINKRIEELNAQLEELDAEKALIQRNIKADGIGYGFDRHWMWSEGVCENPYCEHDED